MLYGYNGDWTEEMDSDDLKPIMKNVVDIKATKTHLVILNVAGRVYMLDPQLINRSFILSKSREIKLPGKVAQISTGSAHCAVLLVDGRVFIWGEFESPPYRIAGDLETPVAIIMSRFVRIASGRDHFLALTEDGDIYSMGCGMHGQLGRVPQRTADGSGRRGTLPLVRPDLVRLKFKHAADRIWASGNCSYYRDFYTHEVFAFGENTNGELAPYDAKISSETVFLPIRTRFHNVADVGTQLMVTDAGQVFTCPQWATTAKEKAGPLKWTAMRGSYKARVIKHCIRNDVAFLIDYEGKVCQWMPAEKNVHELTFEEGMNEHILQLEAMNNWLFLINRE